MPRVSIKDSDRKFLEIMAISISRDIDRGKVELRPILEEVFAALPDAPEYVIEGIARRMRG